MLADAYVLVARELRLRRVKMRVVYTSCGLACLGLAFVGVFLPLLPTTPLVILAAFCFSRGSERLHRWLLAQPLFGPMLRDWQAHRVIRFKVKCVATSMIVVMMGYLVFFPPLALWLRLALAGVAVSVLAYIWSFPSESEPALEPARNRVGRLIIRAHDRA